MSSELLAAFVGFAFATLFTPGPNNIMLLSSGLTFGFRRTLPHVAGVAIGFSVMVAAMAWGVIPIVQQRFRSFINPSATRTA